MKQLALVFTMILFLGCVPKEDTDPLKNTRKLIAKGHNSLYENGMLEIPFTKIHFIPAVKESYTLAGTLFFEDAREALIEALKDALSSVYIIPEGSKKAYRFSEKLYQVSDDLSEDIIDITKEGGIWLINASSAIAKEHILKVLPHAYKTGKNIYDFGESLEELFAVDIIDDSYKRSKKFLRKALRLSSWVNKKTNKYSHKHFQFAKDTFVEGYLALPKTLNKTYKEIKNSLVNSRVTQAFESAEDFREEGSLYFKDIISNSVSNYAKQTGESFSKVGRDFGKNVDKEGLMLSSLKSMRWLLQAVFYDAIIEPLAKLTVGTLGLISVNGIIYPVHLLANESAALAQVIVEVSYQSAKSVYDITAPSIGFAIASVIGASEYVGGKTIAAATVVAGATSATLDMATSTTLSAVSHTAGFLLGKTTKYIGVPLAVSTQAIGEVSYGVLASGSAALVGSSSIVLGETAGIVTKGSGVALATTTLVTGTGLSVIEAASKGLYHVSKAVVLPSTLTLSAGTVLGYGSITQLQAHTLLAATDAAYLILSLEGPKWVIYTLSGNRDSTPLGVGTVVNLKKAVEDNHIIKRIPVSDEEIQKVLKSLGKELPVL